MKLSSEVKIGILATVTLAILVIGYRFLKGSNLFDRSKLYYAMYRDVEMLDASAPVLARGIKVGTVIKVALKPDNPDSVIVTMDVKEEIKLPVDAVAVLVSTGLMGGKAIELRFHHHCEDDCMPNKSFIRSETQSLLGGMVNTQELKSYMKDLGPDLDTLMNKSQLGSNVNKSSVDLAITLQNFAEISKQLQSLLKSSDRHIQNSLQNIDKLTNSLASNTKTIDKTLHHLSAITEQLKEADPGKLVKNSDQAIQEINKTVTEAKEAVKQLSNLLTEIDKGQGSLGKLIKDPALFKNLEKSTKNIDLLLQDMRLNPNRYIHISVFGSKNKQYEKPAQDPAE
ncbi:MAG: MCE family protein [Saprospiraceae bacterium]|nr:MCE family protein [Saprospiraceae bacterium]